MTDDHQAGTAGGRASDPAGDQAGERAGSGTTYVGLLTQVMANTLDEDYETVARDRAARGQEHRARRSGGVVVGLVLFGILVGAAAVSTQRDQPRLEAEREELIDQIQSRQARLDALQGSISAADEEITLLQANVADQLESSSALQQRLDTLGVSAGTIAVEGPGMTVTVDDAPDAAAGSDGVISDRDLQALANGLWAAGAEAIAIDGHRLTALTAIRFAGQAITVDYRSLTPPYVVDVIGNPDTLPAELMETQGGQLWTSLELNFGIQYDYQTRDPVLVPADPHEHLNYAESGAR